MADPVLTDQEAGRLAAKFGILPAEDFKQIAAQYGIEPSSIDTNTLKRISTTFDSGVTVQGTESDSMRAIRNLDEFVTKNIPGSGPSPFLHPAQRAESVDSGTTVARGQMVSAPSTDISGEHLNRHLKGVLADQGDNIIAAAKANNLDPTLLTAVMQFESANGTSHVAVSKNNVGGIWDERAQTSRTFSSVPDSINYTARLLKTNYIDKGLDTVEKIGAKFAPVGAANDPNKTNAEWPAAVRSLQAALGGKGVVSRGQAPASTASETVDPASPVYIQPIDRSKLRAPTGRNDLTADEVSAYARSQADDYATTLAKAGTPLTVGEYKQQLSNFYLAAQKQNLGVQPERLPVDQVDSLASLHQGIDLIDQIAEKQKAVADKYGTLYGTQISQPLAQTDEYKAFDTARQLAISTLARGVGGQKGVLTDNDVKIMKDALPNEHDTPAQVASKVAILKQQSLTMMRDKLAYLQANHYDVANMARLYAGTKASFDATRPDKSLDAAQNGVKRETQLQKANQKAKLVSTPAPTSTPAPSPAVPSPVPAPTPTSPSMEPIVDQTLAPQTNLFGS